MRAGMSLTVIRPLLLFSYSLLSKERVGTQFRGEVFLPGTIPLCSSARSGLACCSAALPPPAHSCAGPPRQGSFLPRFWVWLAMLSLSATPLGQSFPQTPPRGSFSGRTAPACPLFATQTDSPCRRVSFLTFALCVREQA